MVPSSSHTTCWPGGGVTRLPSSLSPSLHTAHDGAPCSPKSSKNFIRSRCALRGGNRALLIPIAPINNPQGRGLPPPPQRLSIVISSLHSIYDMLCVSETFFFLNRYSITVFSVEARIWRLVLSVCFRNSFLP